MEQTTLTISVMDGYCCNYYRRNVKENIYIVIIPYCRGSKQELYDNDPGVVFKKCMKSVFFTKRKTIHGWKRMIKSGKHQKLKKMQV